MASTTGGSPRIGSTRAMTALLLGLAAVAPAKAAQGQPQPVPMRTQAATSDREQRLEPVRTHAAATDRETSPEASRTPARAAAPAEAATAAAAPAATAAEPSLAVGAPPADYTLDAGDTTNGTFYYDSYRLHLGRVEAVRIDMVAPGFDTVLEIFRPQGGEPLGSNDDWTGESLNSRLYFTAPAEGDYVVRARGFRMTDIGPYTLQVMHMPSPPPPIPITLREIEGGGAWTGSVQGRLTEANPVIDDSRRFGDDYRYALYALLGAAGDRLRITMRSTQLSPRLRLTAMGELSSATGAPVGGVGDATLSVVLPRAGRYVVWAEAPTAQSGSYQLDIERLEAAAPAEMPILRFGSSVSDILGPGASQSLRGDGSGEIDFFYHMYRLPVTAGQVLTLIVASRNFYAGIEVGVESPLGFAVAQISAPAPGSTRLVLRPTESGELLVRVRNLGTAGGGYLISVMQGETPLPPAG
jgi:hypothetical protein